LRKRLGKSIGPIKHIVPEHQVILSEPIKESAMMNACAIPSGLGLFPIFNLEPPGFSRPQIVDEI
jgi:hypothetical protein